MKNYLAMLCNHPLFSDVSEPRLENVLKELDASKQDYKEDEILLHTGDITNRFGIVLFGNIQILKEDFFGNVTLLAGLAEQDIFAEAFAAAGVPLTVAVQAENDVGVLWLNATRLFQAEGKEQSELWKIGQHFMHIFAEKNLFLTQRIEHLSRRSLREKVLSFLSGQAAEGGSRRFTIPFDRQGLADYLAADRSALSAVLGKLRDEGIITFHKNEFTLL